MSRSFSDLVAEAEAAPIEGWDFSWLDGRATEERPPWGYARMLAERLSWASASLDIQTGGGEVYAEALARADPGPLVVAATDGWPPNLAIARRALASWYAEVVEVGEDGALPFADASFYLVSSRHPTGRRWDEIARVLRPGGIYLSQGVGSGSNRELYEYLMGPQPDAAPSSEARAVAGAEAAGLTVVDFRSAVTRVQFFDVGAVVYFLRKVVWTVPDFSVERYRGRLAELHEQIQRDGRFVAHSRRYLIEARKTAS